jgi:holo-[acyl-carrier-protein] synthase
MICGIGADIVQVERMKNFLGKHGEEGLDRIFSEEEMLAASKKTDKVIFLAGRWAAKEAVSKSLGCGIGSECSWNDVTVSNNDLGAPFVQLKGNALLKSGKLGVKNVHISISHEKEYAVAFVILEK